MTDESCIPSARTRILPLLTLLPPLASSPVPSPSAPAPAVASGSPATPTSAPKMLHRAVLSGHLESTVGDATG